MQLMTQVRRRSSISHIGSTLTIKRWINRVEEDVSGLTFQEWDPTQRVETSLPPVAMVITPANCVSLVSSSRKFFLQHLRDLYVLTCVREDRGCEGLREWVLKGLWRTNLLRMGPKRFVLQQKGLFCQSMWHRFQIVMWVTIRSHDRQVTLNPKPKTRKHSSVFHDRSIKHSKHHRPCVTPITPDYWQWWDSSLSWVEDCEI